MRVSAAAIKLLAAAAVAILVIAAAPAYGRAKRDRVAAARPTTFSGQCQLSGIVAFSPPLTATPKPTRDRAYEQGTCSGTLTNRRGRTTNLSDAPVRYFATDFGSEGSCGENPESTGDGELVFSHARIGFTLSESRVANVATLSLTGRHGGSAQGQATVSSSANTQEIAEQCLGPGLKSTPVNISLETTPSIS